MEKTIYSIVITEYHEHNMGTITNTYVPYASDSMENAKQKFDELLVEKLEELDYDMSECEFGADFGSVIKFKMRDVVKEVEDDWFDMKITATKLI